MAKGEPGPRSSTRDSRQAGPGSEVDREPWDLVVVGAGPAGSVRACSALAAAQGVRVALIDHERFPRDKSCGDAVRSDAASVLRELGLSGIFEGRPEIHHLVATCPPRFGFLHGIVDKNTYSYYIVERVLFDHYLYEAAIERGARDYTGFRLTDAKFDDSSELWELSLKSRNREVFGIRARVLVGADGAGSRVRRLAGISLNDDKHTSLGLRAYAQAEGMAAGTMRIDWLESMVPGYDWTFPLLSGKVNIGVGLDQRDYKRNGVALESYLEEYVRYLSTQGIEINGLSDTRTHPLPLASQSVPLVPGQNVALIGDAAAMIDPFSGEGIHYGIWAGREVGRIAGRCSTGSDVQAGLESYAKAYPKQFGEEMELGQSIRVGLRFLRFFG